MESKPTAIEITDREFAKLVVTSSVIAEAREGKTLLSEGDVIAVICRSSQIEPPKVKVVNIKSNELNDKLVDIEVKLL